MYMYDKYTQRKVVSGDSQSINLYRIFFYMPLHTYLHRIFFYMPLHTYLGFLQPKGFS